MDFLTGLRSLVLLKLHDNVDASLPDYLPQAAYFYNTYYSPYAPYLAPIYRALFMTQSLLYRYVFPFVYPLYILSNNAIQSLTSDAPDLITLGILAAAFVISLKVLDYMRRTIIYWMSMAIRLGMWATLAGAVFYVSQRGMEQSVEDFGWLWGLLAGLGEEGEKIGGRKAMGKERAARSMAGSGQRGRTRGAGW